MTLAVSVQADVQNLSVLMRWDLDLKVEHTGLLIIVLTFSKINVGDKMSLIWQVLVVKSLVLRVS